mgnify:CR=1 FL=1
MNKMTRVLVIALVCILAASTSGLANATPRTLKQVNLLYSTSVEPTTVPDTPWLPVAGNQVSDFKLKLDGSATTWYYLDIKFIKPTLPAGLTTFKLTPPTDPAFWAYWAAKGVDGSATMVTWQQVMWNIINGNAAMFGLTSDGNGNYMLVDGLQKILGQGDNPLRLNGDYPKGTYTFTVFYDNLGLANQVMTITFK